jgi:cytosine/adenosine deaminase-related metal-dependent hydrolase
MSEIQADLVVRNGFVITMNDARECLERGAVAILGNKIVAVGTDRDIARTVKAKRAIDAQGGVIHPGFVDTHVHFMNTVRGAVPDSADTSIMMNTFRRWWDSVEEEDERAATLLNCIEMLSNGTTCFLEAGTLQFPDLAAEAAAETGIRGLIGDPFLWDVPTPAGTHAMTRAPRDRNRSLKLLGGQLKRNRGEPLIRGCVVLFGLGSASDELMQAAKELSDSHQVIFSQHQSFDTHDGSADEHRLGKRAMCHYADHDLVGENCTFSHMNDLTADEAEIVRHAGMSVVWCPVTSMNLGAGAAKHARHLEMLRAGVNVSLASDGAVSGCRYDIGLQGLVGLLSSRAKSENKLAFSAEDVLELATRGGAKAVGMLDQIGSTEPGKYADLVIRTTDLPEAQPITDPIQALVYSCGSKSIATVIVNGEIAWSGGQPARVEAAMVYDLARSSRRRMWAKLSLAPESKWPLLV